ncbi:MAG: 4Fe-4S binding protein [Candidatus Saganbacteria bacterium]|nr:4Fe-4S binding protein [Candidatus Saganbacteria bacterium]
MLGALIPESIRQLFKKAATNMYPAEQFATPADFRGKLVADIKKCIGCKLCMRDCSAQAIEVIDVTPPPPPEAQEKQKKKFKLNIYLDRCVYCGQCMENCPTDTLSMESTHDLASYDRASLKTEYEF